MINRVGAFTLLPAFLRSAGQVSTTLSNLPDKGQSLDDLMALTEDDAALSDAFVSLILKAPSLARVVRAFGRDYPWRSSLYGYNGIFALNLPPVRTPHDVSLPDLKYEVDDLDKFATLLVFSYLARTAPFNSCLNRGAIDTAIEKQSGPANYLDSLSAQIFNEITMMRFPGLGWYARHGIYWAPRLADKLSSPEFYTAIDAQFMVDPAKARRALNLAMYKMQMVGSGIDISCSRVQLAWAMRPQSTLFPSIVPNASDTYKYSHASTDLNRYGCSVYARFNPSWPPNYFELFRIRSLDPARNPLKPVLDAAIKQSTSLKESMPSCLVTDEVLPSRGNRPNSVKNCPNTTSYYGVPAVPIWKFIQDNASAMGFQTGDPPYPSGYGEVAN